uniref:Small ribosomal subunit protein uS3c n=2 Tax=Adiantum TaxID=13817 RepID=A0A7M3UJ99_9MONI|nr:ribosomal protein S3 [Adiantum nelumboides]YP_010341237.1 ribosomal protein S3 [Adiantum reniforme var. sinense]QMQ99237.1 ribosomal protein S3 [Adiantum nelumboides]QOH99664.1 ribosomal protein S3 [Adiantum reniforme var. sinense]UNZ94143.1 ribosomal protein S3 [Adiantum reniforme var. sinense]
MGRKIHPLGFRLGVNQKHYSFWFAQKRDYPKFLEEDRKIRTFVEKYIQKHVKSVSNYGGVEHIEIQRKTDLIQIDIHTGFPDLLIEEQSLGISQIKHDLGNILGFESRNLRVTLTGVTQPYGEPKILAEHVASQLKNRVPFRRTMKKTIEMAARANGGGIKIQIAGRLNGSEMARVEWAREGRVPLQTVQADVRYCYHPAQTIHGVLGIKTWVFRDN